MNSESIIELSGLSLDLGGRRILDDLNAELKGKAIGLLGPNGAGKTTLMNAFLGFYPLAAGTAKICGLDIVKDPQGVRSLLGYMPERDAFIAGMPAVKFVQMMGELSGLSAEAALERAHEAFFFVGLGEARYRSLETFSLGMKQMAKLAQAIVHGPKLILLDEPTNGLDPRGRQRMLELIREIRDSREATLLISSHLLRDVEACCDEVLILKEGRIARYLNLEAERKSYAKFLILELRGDGQTFAREVQALGAECAFQTRRRLKVILPQDREVKELYRIAARTQVQIRRLSVKRDSLEDIFLEAMENGQPVEPVMEVIDGAA